MPRHIQMRLVLTGPLAGATRMLNGHYFERGVCVIQGAPDNLEHVLTYMRRSYQAYPEGSVELQDAQRAYEDAKAMKLRELEANGVRNIPAYLKPPKKPTEVSSDIQPNGAGASEVPPVHGGTIGASEAGDAGAVSGGDGLPDAGATDAQPAAGPNGDTNREPAGVSDSRLKTAILSLDPENDAHWTGQDLPAMAAIEAAYGSTDVTRNAVEAELPGWTRTGARELAAEKAAAAQE